MAPWGATRKSSFPTSRTSTPSARRNRTNFLGARFGIMGSIWVVRAVAECVDQQPGGIANAIEPQLAALGLLGDRQQSVKDLNGRHLLGKILQDQLLQHLTLLDRLKFRPAPASAIEKD